MVDGSVEQQEGVANPTTTTPAEAVRYYLSDTPCSQSAPVAPSTHMAHNTLGPCSAGVQTEATPGAPDRLFKNSFTSPTGNFDFSSEVVTSQAFDAGLQVPVQPKQCDYAPSRSDARLQVHRWLTAPVTSGADLVLDGTATLALWSKTINNAVHPGRLCVWLFVREPTINGGEADTLIEDVSTGLDYFTYTADPPGTPDNWSASWNQYSVPLAFEELQLQPGDRIGMAIAVDAAGTPGEALQFSYNYGGPESARDSTLTVYSTNKARAPG